MRSAGVCVAKDDGGMNIVRSGLEVTRDPLGVLLMARGPFFVVVNGASDEVDADEGRTSHKRLRIKERCRTAGDFA